MPDLPRTSAPPALATSAGPGVEQAFRRALDGLVATIREDRTILAAILCGSLSHDTVWARSDIDLVLVTVDDRKPAEQGLSLDADGVNVHASLVPRAEFRRLAEGSMRNSFMHSLLAKGRLLYTHDPTIAELCERLHEIGARDTELQLLRAATHALPPVYKAHKWLVTRGDLHYTALWLLYAATPLAQIEVVGRGLIADREVIPQAMRLNPDFFRIVYTDLLDGPKTEPGVRAALAAVDAYLAERARSLFALVLDHLREVGEARSCTEIEHHFTRTFGVAGVTTACEYLADMGMLAKTSVPARLTRRSQVDVPERAFVALDA
jgi:hypothetical protein